MTTPLISGEVLEITQPERKHSSTFSVTFSGLKIVDNAGPYNIWQVGTHFPGAMSVNVYLEPARSTGKKENIRVGGKGSFMQIHRPKLNDLTYGDEYVFSVDVSFPLDHSLNLDEYECPKFSLLGVY